MTTKLENTLSSYLAVNSFFAANGVDLVVLIALYAVLLADYNDQLAKIQTDEQLAAETKVGFTLQKKATRAKATTKLVIIASAWIAYYESIDDKVNATLVKNKKSTWNRMKYTKFAIEAEAFYKRNVPFINGIATNTVDAAYIGALGADVEEYKTQLSQTGAERAKCIAYRKDVTADFAATKKIIRKFDFAFEDLRESHPTLFNTYFAARKRYDYAASYGEPTITFIIPANSYFQGYLIPYNVTRYFRVINKSNEAVYWGLSTSAASFTNLQRVLGGKFRSNVSSKTLGDDGDIVLFHNPTNTPVTIELWATD